MGFWTKSAWISALKDRSPDCRAGDQDSIPGPESLLFRSPTSITLILFKAQPPSSRSRENSWLFSPCSVCFSPLTEAVTAAAFLPGVYAHRALGCYLAASRSSTVFRRLCFSLASYFVSLDLGTFKTTFECFKSTQSSALSANPHLPVTLSITCVKGQNFPFLLAFFTVSHPRVSTEQGFHIR